MSVGTPQSDRPPNNEPRGSFVLLADVSAAGFTASAEAPAADRSQGVTGTPNYPLEQDYASEHEHHHWHDEHDEPTSGPDATRPGAPLPSGGDGTNSGSGSNSGGAGASSGSR
jgi:hypothetical protein